MDLWGQAFDAVVVITMFLTLLFILAAFNLEVQNLPPMTYPMT